MLAVALATLAALAPAPAPRDTTWNDVTLADRIEVGGQALVLNGVALRKKAIFKVYVAGLYLPARQSSAEAILAADGARHIVLEFLRGVDEEKMCEAMNDGLAANTPNASQLLVGDFAKLCTMMEKVDKGDRYEFTYLPGTGTTVQVKGVAKGTIPGKPFADALWKAWIGPKPGPGEGFKKDLLGG